MTLIELIHLCVNRPQEERQALLEEIGVGETLIEAIQRTFTNDGQLVGALDTRYKITTR